jgi:hypothetical protein
MQELAMDGGGEGVLRGIKRGGGGGGELAATERKGLRVKRAKGGRHGILFRSPSPLLSDLLRLLPRKSNGEPSHPSSEITFPRRCAAASGLAHPSSEINLY